MPEIPARLERTVQKRIELDYYLFTPKAYQPAGRKKWPLILFLHGASGRNGPLAKIKRDCIPQMLENQERFGFLLAAPQCPKHTWWVAESERLITLLDELLEKHAVDPQRIYLTGWSMGGYGTWSLAADYPKRFAAIAPVSGAGFWWNGFPQRARLLKHVPVWAFHGSKDGEVPIVSTQEMVEELKVIGGDIRITEYSKLGHDIYEKVYSNPEFYEWLFEHTLPPAK
jgi:predicted peptidase